MRFKRKFLNITSYAYLALVILSCSSSEIEYTVDTEINPSKINPLSAVLRIAANKECQAQIKVLGASPFEQSFETKSTKLTVPVLGLYPNKKNKVELTLKHAGGIKKDTLLIQTGPLPANFATIEINKVERSKMESGWHGCDIHYANYGKFHSTPMIFDDQGAVRWFLDLGFAGRMVSPFQLIDNNRLIINSRNTIYEFDMLGSIIKKQTIDNNYGYHHDFVVLPNKDLLLAVGKRDSKMTFKGAVIKSDNDWIALWDSKKGQIVKEWDLAKHLDVNRDDLQLYRNEDWLHMNGLDFNPKDSTILISNKNQGLCKISWDDKLEWILCPKQNWGKAGRDGQGPDTRPSLLTAVDENEKPFNSAVQNGTESADNFDFAWGNHAPLFLPNGNILVFDNGTHRNFDLKPTYSRAVEYKINKNDMTVQQVWEYGKARGENFYSGIVSDVDYLSETTNRLVTSGFLLPGSKPSGKIVEVNPQTNEAVFEATVYFKSLNGTKQAAWGQRDILYRSERINLAY